MPIHDWTTVSAGTFHNFHFLWTATLANRLNAGVLPPGFFAMAEQVVGGPEADQESERYARKARRIAIQHGLGNVVAVIEIVSPGNKNSRHALRAFVTKAAELIWCGVHLLVIDLFPPTARDPQGMHQAIWEEIGDQPFTLPAGKPLTLASYQAAPTRVAYVEPVAVGERLPSMALFLHDTYYVHLPLEETYLATWHALPNELRQLFEPSSGS